MAVDDFGGFTRAIDGFFNSVTDMQSAFVPYGQTLLASICFLMLVWIGITTMVFGGSSRNLLGKAIGLILNYGIASLLIANLGTIANVLSGTVDDLGSKVTNGALMGSKGASKPSDTIMQAVVPLFKVAVDVFNGSAPKTASNDDFKDDVIVCTETDIDGNHIQDCPDNGTKGSKKGGLSSVFAVLTSLVTSFVYWVIAGILKVITIVVLMVAGLVAACQFMISQILIKIAIIMGPILIPFMIWESASWIWDGWLKFTIKAFAHKLVGIVILAILGQGISGAVKAIGDQTGLAWDQGEIFRLSGMIAVVGMGFLAYFLANLIPSIADGLFAGMARTNLAVTPSAPKMPKQKTEKEKPTPNPEGSRPSAPGGESGQSGTSLPGGGAPALPSSLNTVRGGNAPQLESGGSFRPPPQLRDVEMKDLNPKNPSSNNSGHGGGGFRPKGTGPIIDVEVKET